MTVFRLREALSTLAGGLCLTARKKLKGVFRATRLKEVIQSVLVSSSGDQPGSPRRSNINKQLAWMTWMPTAQQQTEVLEVIRDNGD